jgi:phosphoglycolate phosphatase-like HAD superfamily hydrolase
MLTLKNTKTFIFDCDGVILDSNRLKSDGFYEIARPFGEPLARAMVAYHEKHGGVSRFEKVKWLLEQCQRSDEGLARQLVDQFGEIIETKMAAVPFVEGIKEFLTSLPSESRRFVITGAEQNEVRRILRHRGLAVYFTEIFGSPETKKAHMADIKQRYGLDQAVFFGDASTDYEAAKAFGTDFVFVSGYTILPNWQDAVAKWAVPVIKDFRGMVSLT